MDDKVKDLASRIKAKFPDYAQVDDRELVQKIVQKHPEYQEYLGTPEPSDGTLPSILKQAGWSDDLIPTMTAIGMAESSGNPHAVNDGKKMGTNEYSVGLWQVNRKAHPQYDEQWLKDPVNNAKAALDIYKKQGLKAWGAYTDGRYKKYLNGNVANTVIPQSYAPEVADVPQVSVNVGDVVPTAYPDGGTAMPPITKDWNPFSAPTVPTPQTLQSGGETPAVPQPAYNIDPNEIIQVPLRQNDRLPLGIETKPVTPIDPSLKKQYAEAMKTYGVGDSEQFRQKFLQGFTSEDDKYLRGFSAGTPQTAQIPQPKRGARGGYDFERTGKLKLKDGTELSYDPGRENLAPDEYRFKDKDGQPYITDVKKGEVRREQLIAPLNSLAPASATNAPGSAIGKNPLTKTYYQKPTVRDIINDGLGTTYGASFGDAARAYKEATGGKELWIQKSPDEEIQRAIDSTFDPKTKKVNIAFENRQEIQDVVNAYNRNGKQGVIDYLQTQQGNKEQAQNEISQVNAQAKAVADSPETIEQRRLEGLRMQAYKNIEDSPLTATTPENVEKEYQRLLKIQLAPETEKSLIEAGEKIKANGSEAGSPDIAVGLVRGLGGLSSAAAGLMRFGSVLGLPGFDRAYTDLSKIGTGARLIATHAKKDDLLGEVGDIAGGAVVDVPKYVALSALPGGAIVAFGVDAGLQSAGRGEGITNISKEASKGLITGALFHGAGKLANLAERGLLNKILTPEELNAVDKGLLNSRINPGAPRPDIAGKVLAANIFGGATRVGTIGAGTFAVEKSYGNSNEDAFRSAVTMALFDLAMHAPKVGDITDLAGKVFRVSKEGRTADVTVSPKGEVLLLNGEIAPEVAPKVVDAEINLDKVTDVELDENGVYRAEGDTAQGAKTPREAPVSKNTRDSQSEIKRIDNEIRTIKDTIPDLASDPLMQQQAKKAVEALEAEKRRLADQETPAPTSNVSKAVILSALRENGDLPLKDLSQKTGIPINELTENLAELNEGGDTKFYTKKDTGSQTWVRINVPDEVTTKPPKPPVQPETITAKLTDGNTHEVFKELTDAGYSPVEAGQFIEKELAGRKANEAKISEPTTVIEKENVLPSIAEEGKFTSEGKSESQARVTDTTPNLAETDKSAVETPQTVAPDTSLASIGTVTEKTPSKIDFYMANPNKDGSFNESSAHAQYKDGASIFALQKVGDNRYEVFVNQHPNSQMMAKNYPEITLDPIFEPISAYKPNAEIQTVKPAVVELSGGKYNLVSKGEIDYGREGIERENNKSASATLPTVAPVQASEANVQAIEETPINTAQTDVQAERQPIAKEERGKYGHFHNTLIKDATSPERSESAFLNSPAVRQAVNLDADASPAEVSDAIKQDVYNKNLVGFRDESTAPTRTDISPEALRQWAKDNNLPAKDLYKLKRAELDTKQRIAEKLFVPASDIDDADLDALLDDYAKVRPSVEKLSAIGKNKGFKTLLDALVNAQTGAKQAIIEYAVSKGVEEDHAKKYVENYAKAFREVEREAEREGSQDSISQNRSGNGEPDTGGEAEEQSGSQEIDSPLYSAGNKGRSIEKAEKEPSEAEFYEKAEKGEHGDGVDVDVTIDPDVLPETGRKIDLDAPLYSRPSKKPAEDVATLKSAAKSVKSIDKLKGMAVSKINFYDNTRVGRTEVSNAITGYTPDIKLQGGFLYSYTPEIQEHEGVLAFTSMGMAITNLKRQRQNPQAIQGIAMQNPLTAHLGNVSTLETLFGKDIGIFQNAAELGSEKELVETILNGITKASTVKNAEAVKLGEMLNSAGLFKKFKIETVGYTSKGKPIEQVTVAELYNFNRLPVQTLDDFRDQILIGSHNSFGTRGTILGAILQAKRANVKSNTPEIYRTLHYKYGIPTLDEIARGNEQRAFSNAVLGDIVKFVRPFTDPMVVYTTDKAQYEHFKNNPSAEMKKEGVRIELLPAKAHHISYPFVLKGENIAVLDKCIAGVDLYRHVPKLATVSKSQSFYPLGRMPMNAPFGKVSGTFASQGATNIPLYTTPKSLAEKRESLYQFAWHGSPHRFDKFDISKIGTGEGAQAYGHGLYFTDKESIADHYKNALSRVDVEVNGKKIAPDEPAFAKYDFNVLRGTTAQLANNFITKEDIVKRIESHRKNLEFIDRDIKNLPDTPYNTPKGDLLQRERKQVSEQLKVYEMLKDADVQVKRGGAKYKVDLKPKEDEYLLWDKPLSEQSEKVRKALSQLKKDFPNKEFLHKAIDEHQGMQMYKELSLNTNERQVKMSDGTTRTVLGGSSDKAASEYLKSLGIRGIKYLDGSSRNKGEGSYNYVIFDDADVSIEEILYNARKQADTLQTELDDALAREFTPEDLKKATLTPQGKMNEEAFVLLTHAKQRVFGEGAPTTAWFGVFLNPRLTARVRQGLVEIFNEASSPESKAAGEAFLKQFDAAVEHGRPGALKLIASSRSVPDGLKEAWQEETAHEYDYFEGGEHKISMEIFPNDPVGMEAIENLGAEGSGYEGASIPLLAKEVGAKIRLTNAAEELGISAEKVKHLRRLQIAAFRAAGKTKADLVRIAREIENAGEENVTQRRPDRQRAERNNGEIDAGGTGEIYPRLRGSGERGSGSPVNNLPAKTTASENGQTETLDSLQTTRGITGLEHTQPLYSKPSVVRGALNLVDKALSKSDNLSSVRALEAVFNKNLQQLKEADEDAYEQVLKLAGTQSQVTAAALSGAAISPTFAQALYDSNLTDVATTLELAGLAIPLQRGVPTPTQVLGKTATVLGIAGKNYAVPVWLARELKPVFENAEPNVIQKAMQKLNAFGMAGPLDAIFHSANVVGTVIGATPYVGTDIISRTVGNTPATKWLTTLVQLARNNPEKVDPAMLMEMADAGVIPNRYGRETYSKRLAAQLAAERVRFKLGPMISGPKGIDIRARIAMWKIGKHINPSATNAEMAEFVNQLGIYNKALESQLARNLKRSQIAPFFTAGSTMLKNGALMWLNKTPMPTDGMSMAARASLRAQQQFSAGALGILALWVGASLLYRGLFPWEDKDSRFMQIPLNDDHRHTPLVNALYGDNQKTAYVGLGFLSPLLERGARGLGVSGAYDTAILGGGLKQSVEAGAKDTINSLAHPVFTGPLSHAVFGISGYEPQVKSMRDRSGKFGFSLWKKDLPKGAGFGTALEESALELNPMVGSIVHSLGINRDEEKPEDVTKGEANVYFRSILDMAFPRLLKGPVDREKVRERTLQEGEAIRREEKVPEKLTPEQKAKQLNALKALRDKTTNDKARENYQRRIDALEK